MSTNAYMLNETEQKVIKKLYELIEWKDKLDYNSGSCGDGNFDNKTRELEHQEKQTAMRVIRQFVL